MSHQTTDLGPRLSATTVQDGGGETRAKVDLTEASLGIRVSTSAATSGVDGAYIDGEIIAMDQTASDMSLVIRSGNTLYFFSADGAIGI